MSEKLTFRDIFVKGSVVFNPVLVQLAGLCPVVAASTSLKNAAMLSVIAFAELIVVCVVASALLKKIPRWVRMPIYLVIGLAFVCPILWYIETQTLVNLSLGMKIYIPLIAINSVVAVHCEQFAVKNSVKLAFYDAAAVGIGASAVFITVGALRELLGSSSIGGIAVNIPVAFKGMLMPFGSLIILGFMAAVLKAFVSKRCPEYIQKPIAAEEKKEETTEIAKVELPATEETVEETAIAEVPVSEPEAEPAAEENPIDAIKIMSEKEIDDFLKSLGIDTEGTGDKQ